MEDTIQSIQSDCNGTHNTKHADQIAGLKERHREPNKESERRKEKEKLNAWNRRRHKSHLGSTSNPSRFPMQIQAPVSVSTMVAPKASFVP